MTRRRGRTPPARQVKARTNSYYRMSQTEVAEHLGVNVVTVQNIERKALAKLRARCELWGIILEDWLND